ncbi:IS5 family transposase [Streptomyces mirabilis]
MIPKPAWAEGRGGRPEEYCHRDILDAIRYAVDNGVKWPALPADYPPGKAVHRFFTRWRKQGLTGEFHDRLRAATRGAGGRDAEPTAGVIDSQSAKGTSTVEAATSGYDGGKKIKGRKRHIVVDTLGLILAVMVTPASTGDRDAAQDLLAQTTRRHHRLRRVWVDSGYTGMLVHRAARDHAGLKPLPPSPYLVAERQLRHVGKDCLVAFDGNLYSVPARKVRPRQVVEVRATLLCSVGVSAAGGCRGWIGQQVGPVVRSVGLADATSCPYGVQAP